MAVHVEYDVVVCGSGPAGATAAYVASERRLRTLLIEKRGPPRDKTCGGLLTNLCVDFIREIFRSAVPGDVQIPPSPMSVFVAPPSGVAHGFLVPGEQVLNVTRRAFDGWLTREAVERGADLRSDSELLGYRSTEDHIEVDLRTPSGEAHVRTRYLIGADGVYSKVREQFRPRPHSARAYYIQEFVPRVGRFEDWFYLMYRGDTSPIYAYVIPKEELLCLGIGVHKSVPPSYEQGMANFKKWLEEEFGFRDLGPRKREGFSVPYGDVVMGGGRILLAGDAAGFCYPPTGEGITFAIQSGAAAASAIADGDESVVDRYAFEMARVAGQVEEAASRTLSLTDSDRETRIRTKLGL